MGLGSFSMSHCKYTLSKKKSANATEKEGPRKKNGGGAVSTEKR